MRLIEEEIDCNPILRARVMRISDWKQDASEKIQEYKFSNSNKPDDTNCIVGWDTLSTEWKWPYVAFNRGQVLLMKAKVTCKMHDKNLS